MPNRNGQVPIVLITFVLILVIVFSTFILGLPYQHSFVAFLALAVFFISFLNTDIALVIIIISMLLSPELRAGVVPTREINVRAEDFLIFVVFIGWMAKMAVKKELGVLRKSPLNMPIALYMLVCVVSSLLAVADARLTVRETSLYLLKYFEYYLLFFMVANNLHTFKQAKKFVGALLAVCFVVCAIAWMQVHTGQRLSTLFEGGGGEPNTFAGYLILMMAVILSFALHAQEPRQRLLWAGFFVFALVPFVFTLSREGWFSFFPMIIAFLIFHRRSRYFILFLLVAAALVVPFTSPKVVHERFKDTFAKERTYDVLGKTVHVSESTAARIDAWERGFVKLSQRPLLGHGVPGSGTIDNQYTRILTETGTLGFLLYAWIIVLIFRLARKTYSLQDTFSKSLSLGLVCGMAGLLAQSLGAAVFVLIRIMEPFWFITALVVTLPEISEESPDYTSDGT